MIDIIFKNLPIKIFSALVAIIVWVVIIASQQTPYQFTDEIDVKAFNMPEQLSLTSTLPKVKIKVITAKEILSSLTVNDFEAYVDMKNVSKGLNTLDVFVTPKIQNVTVAGTDPSRISFKVEDVGQKQVAISTVVTGNPRAGYKAEKPIIVIDKAQVKGAASLIGKVSEVRATIKFDGTENASFEKQIQLKAFDQSGVEVKEVKIDPENINVSINITQQVQQKTVGIKVGIKGTPKNGWIEKITTEPATMEIKGDGKYLDALDYISTEEVDVTEITKTMEKYVPLNIPKNVSIVNASGDRVKVTIEFKPYNK